MAVLHCAAEVLEHMHTYNVIYRYIVYVDLGSITIAIGRLWMAWTCPYIVYVYIHPTPQIMLLFIGFCRP